MYLIKILVCNMWDMTKSLWNLGKENQSFSEHIGLQISIPRYVCFKFICLVQMYRYPRYVPGTEMSLVPKCPRYWNVPGTETSPVPKFPCTEMSLGPKCPGTEMSLGPKCPSTEMSMVPKCPGTETSLGLKCPGAEMYLVPKCPCTEMSLGPKCPYQNVSCRKVWDRNVKQPLIYHKLLGIWQFIFIWKSICLFSMDYMVSAESTKFWDSV